MTRSKVCALLLVLCAANIFVTAQDQLDGNEVSQAVSSTAYTGTGEDGEPTETDAIAVDSVSEADSTETALPWPQSLQTRLDSIIAKSTLLKTSHVGLYVYDLTADSALYALDSKQTMRPASTMKLFTAITALDKLGGAYLYKTQLAYTGSVVDSVRTLHGDLYCIGGMDPKFGKDDMRAFAASVKELGVDTIRGTLYADRSMKDDKIYGEGWCWDDDNSMLSPLVYARKDNFMERFADALADAGITVVGETAGRTTPGNASRLCERTHTIEQVLLPMLKESNNLYAESMFYQIGLTQGKPSTMRKARRVIETLMNKTAVKQTPHRIADGSGLSLYNYVSAEMEVAFLRYAHANSNIYPYLYSALPIAGKDGTLKKRMVGTVAAGNVRAKTGTLTGVITLAGYCTASNGHELAFAILNNGVMHDNNARNFQNKICVALCR